MFGKNGKTILGTVINGERQIFFLSCLNCAMDQTYMMFVHFKDNLVGEENHNL